MGDEDEIGLSNVLRIMVATDNHLGYAEKDPVRGEDSFIAFEEMLQMAVSENVDFILLGGDLFHDAVPSQNSLNRCMKLLRQYTFGDKPISIEILSDQNLNFQSALNQSVNYEDPNLNISIPVFSIHGNHDDPSGFGRLSSLDLLSTTGLVNYFGRWTDLTKIEINPILLRKGESQLALYGLSHIHDARLARLLENSKVTINKPTGEEGEWFHLMVLHQNRADRGPKNYLPEELLPNFINLVIWGHEHDCRIEPEYNHKQDFFVSQPGSSVPTSLAEGESIKKHVGLLEIYNSKFRLEPMQLKTVRPFLFESINLSDMVEELHLDEGDVSNKVKSMAIERVKAMIEQAKDLLTGHPKQPILPLVRLRIIFEDENQMFNAIRFGQAFQEQVANPLDIVLFKKSLKRMKQEENKFDKAAMGDVFIDTDIEANTRVEDLVDRYFEEKGSLKLMPSHALSEMYFRLVDRRDNVAAENIIKNYKEAALTHLLKELPSEENIDEQLSILSSQITHDNILKMIENSDNTSKKALSTNFTTDIIDDDDTNNNDDEFVDDVKNKSKTTKPGRGSGRGSRGGAARGGRGVTGRASRSNNSRGAKMMPQLNVSTARSTTKQETLLDAINRSGTLRSAKGRQIVYTISDDSD